MFTKFIITGALAAGFAASTAHAQRMPAAADPARSTPSAAPDSPIRTYKNARSLSQPANSWQEANVASTAQPGHGAHGAHGMHGMQHGQSGAAAADPHAAHANHADHEGHGAHSAGAAAAADPHAGHVMPPAGAHEGDRADHAMHQDMGAHAGHAAHQQTPSRAAKAKQPQPKKAAPKTAPVKPQQDKNTGLAAPDPHAGHDHGGHQ